MTRFALILGALIFWTSAASAQSCPQQQINAQSGTTYTVLNSDNCKKVSFSNGSAVAVTLPQAGSNSNFGNTWSATFVNLGAGAVTITPTTSTLDGLASRVLQQYQGVTITSNGTNYVSSGLPPVYGSGLSYSAGTAAASSNTLAGGWSFIIDGGGSAITTGSKGFIEIPYACTITAARIVADQTGSIVVDIKKATYSGLFTTASITASAKPTLSSAQKNQDTTLTGWTTSVSAGDWLEYNVDSSTTVQRVTVSLTCAKS